MSVKTFLTTEQRIPGIGNGVLQDILWHAGLDPRCDMRSVTDAEFHALYDALRKTLGAIDVRGRGEKHRTRFLWGTRRLCLRAFQGNVGNPLPQVRGDNRKNSLYGRNGVLLLGQ